MANTSCLFFPREKDYFYKISKFFPCGIVAHSMPPELLSYLCTCLVNIGREKLDQIPLLGESELTQESDFLSDSNLTKEMIDDLLIREKLQRLVQEEDEDFEL